MFNNLKNHPFSVEAFFKASLVLTFSVPKDQIRSLIPPCLQLDTFDDKWAFIAVAMVQTQGLRPKGFPSIFGNDFFLIGYRVFVRFVNNAGKRLRGLYIIKSETDQRKMQVLGNIFTRYNYSTTDIHQEEEDGTIQISSMKSAFHVKVEDTASGTIALPAGSPFSDWQKARRFAGPLPFTFTYLPDSGSVLIIEGVRQNWTPKPVTVVDHSFPYLNELNLEGLRLANAFVIRNISYHWKKGIIESWKPV